MKYDEEASAADMDVRNDIVVVAPPRATFIRASFDDPIVTRAYREFAERYGFSNALNNSIKHRPSDWFHPLAPSGEGPLNGVAW